jgi:membrane protease YdiL (CAAX protease family)
MPPFAPVQTPYHRLAATTTHRWWSTIAGTAFIAVCGALLATLAFGIGGVASGLAGRDDTVNGAGTPGPLADLGLNFLAVAALLPPVLLAARWMQRRPAGSLSSVAGRLRWRWLLTCLPVAFAAVMVLFAGSSAWSAATGITTYSGIVFAGWGSFAVACLVLLPVVPLQAAAEEYLTRGWLMQAVGQWFRRPWVPIVLQAVVFAALHGWGTTWGFADLLIFGAIAGWLTVRTGGLEAAIALHLMNNVLAVMVGAATNDLSTETTAADMPWPAMVIDAVALTAYAAVILWLVRRREATTAVVPVEAPIARPASALVAVR